MTEATNFQMEETEQEEIEALPVTLEDISEDVEEILFSMQDLLEKVALYQTTHSPKEDLQSTLKKIAEFCSQHDEISGILDDHL